MDQSWSRSILLWAFATTFSLYGCPDDSCIRNSDCAAGAQCVHGKCVVTATDSGTKDGLGDAKTKDGLGDAKTEGGTDAKTEGGTDAKTEGGTDAKTEGGIDAKTEGGASDAKTEGGASDAKTADTSPSPDAKTGG